MLLGVYEEFLVTTSNYTYHIFKIAWQKIILYNEKVSKPLLEKTPCPPCGLILVSNHLPKATTIKPTLLAGH